MKKLTNHKIDDISKIEGIDENTAKELKERAEEYLKKEKENIGKKLKELGVEDDLINLKGLTPGMLVTLGEKKIKTLKDFAELSTDELIGGYDEKNGKRFKIDGYLEEFALTKNEAEDLIMNARNIVFLIKDMYLYGRKKKKEKKLTLTASSKKPHNAPHYTQGR